jgi:glutamate synthase domain-containing protein 3
MGETITAHGAEVEVPESAAHLDADGLDARGFNRRLKELAASHEAVVVHNPRSRHNLAVALDVPVHVIFLGSVGYYCGGFNNGATIEIHGNAGWGLGEAMAAGRIVVHGNTGWAAGASMRGGTIVIRGDGGPRTGVAMKGGDILVAGSVGFMSGFMAHAGKLVVLGGAGDALGASMYEGRIFVAGPVRSLGADAVEREPSPEELAEIRRDLEAAGLRMPGAPLRKIVAEGRLWYFDVKEAALWRQV